MKISPGYWLSLSTDKKDAEQEPKENHVMALQSIRKPHCFARESRNAGERFLSALVFAGSAMLFLSACGKRGELIPPEPEPIPFPRQYPAPLPEKELQQPIAKLSSLKP